MKLTRISSGSRVSSDRMFTKWLELRIPKDVFPWDFWLISSFFDWERGCEDKLITFFCVEYWRLFNGELDPDLQIIKNFKGSLSFQGSDFAGRNPTFKTAEVWPKRRKTSIWLTVKAYDPIIKRVLKISKSVSKKNNVVLCKKVKSDKAKSDGDTLQTVLGKLKIG